MYANEPMAPYLGLAMFDPNGQNVNNALTFYAGHRLNWGGDEMRFGRTMRNGIIETETSGPGSYSVLSSAGPFSVEAGESISPFVVAFVVGEDLEDLRNAVALAHQRSALITSVTESQGRIPDEFRLLQNYPNPFNATTKITYHIPAVGKVILKIYNTIGQEIITLVDELQSAGNKSVLWNGRDDGGQIVSSGVYIFAIQVGDQIESRKTVYLK